jgi:DNA-directed RNA polymerase specialized sigma24 family protein
MVEKRQKRVRVVRIGDDVSIRADERVEGADLEEFIEEKELADGTWIMKVRVPSRRRTAADDSGTLGPAAGVSSAIGDLQEKLAELVRQARADGYTWTQIGSALGISKQAAWERFSGED